MLDKFLDWSLFILLLVNGAFFIARVGEAIYNRVTDREDWSDAD